MALTDRVVIVTGATSGIGAAAARLFAARGAKVVLGGRREGALEDVARGIVELGGTVRVLAGDVRDVDCAEALVALAERDFGGLDAAFDNAGITGPATPLVDMDTDTWAEVLETNLSAAFLAARVQIPALRRRGGGAIVFTSSFVGSTVGLPGMGAYAASKAGLLGLVQVLAVEHGPERIRVNALMPGGTRTPMAGTDPAFHDWVAGIHALKRMAEPREIAEAAAFLLSDRASFVTGSALYADGGNSILKA